MALLTRDDGVVQQTDAEVPQLEAAGYHRCYTNNWKKRAGIWIPCPFWLSPEAVEATKDKAGGYYTCPVCQRSYDLLSELPWHGVAPDEAESNQREDQQAHNWAAGGGTRIGLKMDAQAQIGEDLVEQMGEIPGYGPITWWHKGGAATNSPLDGATEDWGVEVKTIGYDATHHRFVPGRPAEKNEKNAHAERLGKKGVLGVLVLLDYRRSVADIFVKPMPLGDRDVGGQTLNGVSSFRSSSGEHLVKEVPFRNPLMDPQDPAPHVETGHSAFTDEEGNETF